ncbi:hypothetical protein J3R30DRAFT_3703258 [Lentinula aciculospora]|uniref:Zn(2)-C6 fungal-type domain-containing protein n=1 Tax=Lentinula aciculospora TaxID=153920 RepID=A0A9W9ABQ2_9AGAR|nr:hypothetical protein J3R30DRAFT_3703258 [Lentinula aciculospora]
MSTAARSKRKKPPACDYCKSHRVICHSQSNGSCPRCVEKGVNCKTTPVIRRKRRTKAELAQASAKETISNPSAFNSPSSGPAHHSPSVTVQCNGDLSTMVIVRPQVMLVTDNSTEPVPVPPTLQLSTELVKDLMQIPRNVPYDTHPLIANPVLPLSQLKMKLQLHSWDLHSLSPEDRVLASCLLTFSALYSMNPCIIGHGEICAEESQILTSPSPLKTPVVCDLRQFGFQREFFVRQLWAESLWLANQAGIATNTSKENAASCWILGYLRYVILDQGASAFSSACVYHLRTLAEAGMIERHDGGMLELRGYMIVESASALMTRKNIPLTPNDEKLIVPVKPEPLEQLIRTFATKACSASEMFLSIHTFTHNLVHLARETVENLSGAFARSQPLDECFLIKHFASLDVFHTYLIATLRQISRLVQSRPPLERTRSYYLRACAQGFAVSWGSLVFALFELIRDRSMCCGKANGSGSSSVGITVAGEMSDDRLLMHLRHTRKLASRTAVEISETIRDVPSVTRLIPPGDSRRWVSFLMLEENVVGITREQCFQALECFRDALKLMGFLHADRTGVVEAINERLACYAVGNIHTQQEAPSQDLRSFYGAGSGYSWFETRL